MANNPIIITLPYTADLDRGPVEQYLPVAFGTGDKEAHKLILTAYRATGIVDLTGAGVLCYVNRADKTTVVVDGEVVDGKAVVVLPEECYIVNGVVSIIVKLNMGDTRTTALWLNGNINRTRNGKLVDPGGVVPSLEELLAQIDNMEAATAKANAAAANADAAREGIQGDLAALTEEMANKAPQSDVNGLSKDVSSLVDMTVHINLFDKTRLEDAYIDTSGKKVNAADCKTTAYNIAVAYGTTYTYTPGKYVQIIEYGASDEFIGRITDFNVSTYTPTREDVNLVKITSWGSNVGFFGDTFMFVAGELPAKFVAYGRYVKPDRIVDFAGVDEKIAATKTECNQHAEALVNTAVESLKLPETVSVLHYTLEQFEGNTKQEKFRNALDALSVSGGILSVGDLYIGESYTPQRGMLYNRITIVDSCISIGVDGWWNGTGLVNVYVPQFANCKISCASGCAIFKAGSGDGIKEPRFLNCRFYNAILLKSTVVHMQNLNVIDCKFDGDGSYPSDIAFCTASQYWSLRFIRNNVTGFAGTIIAASSTESREYDKDIFHGIIRENTIQGNSSELFKLSSATTLIISDNYFELNSNRYIRISGDVYLFEFARNDVYEANVNWHPMPVESLIVLDKQPEICNIKDNYLDIQNITLTSN